MRAVLGVMALLLLNVGEVGDLDLDEGAGAGAGLPGEESALRTEPSGLSVCDTLGTGTCELPP